MAVFTRNRERAVRALGVALLREDIWSEQNQPKNEQESGTDLCTVRRKLPLALDLAPSRVESAELR